MSEKPNAPIGAEEEPILTMEEVLTEADPAQAPAAAAEAQPEDPVRQELAAAKAQAEEYLNLAQRVQADFDNFRKRNVSVRADAFADGQRSVAASMLEVLDNLERALSLAEADTPLRAGIELTLRQMNGVYEKLGVTVIDRTGEKFDPNLENAVMQGTAEEGEPGTVCQVFQKGYRIGDHVLRHAMVKVVAES